MYRKRFEARVNLCEQRRKTVGQRIRARKRAEMGNFFAAAGTRKYRKEYSGVTGNKAAILACLGASRMRASEKNVAEWQRDTSYP